jgi:hypothetical protein
MYQVPAPIYRVHYSYRLSLLGLWRILSRSDDQTTERLENVWSAYRG